MFDVGVLQDPPLLWPLTDVITDLAFSTAVVSPIINFREVDDLADLVLAPLDALDRSLLVNAIGDAAVASALADIDG